MLLFFVVVVFLWKLNLPEPKRQKIVVRPTQRRTCASDIQRQRERALHIICAHCSYYHELCRFFSIYYYQFYLQYTPLGQMRYNKRNPQFFLLSVLIYWALSSKQVAWIFAIPCSLHQMCDLVSSKAPFGNLQKHCRTCK